MAWALKPKTFWVTGAGTSREELKALLLEKGEALTIDTVQTLEGFAVRILSTSRGQKGLAAPRVLGPSARWEALAQLFQEPAIKDRLPELRRLSRQRRFLKRLDRALQSARLAFAHEGEQRVIAERLAEWGDEPLRNEVQFFSAYWQVWMEAQGVWDLPQLLTHASRVLEEEGWPQALARPEKVVYWTAATPESLERRFWEAVARWVSCERWPDELEFKKNTSVEVKWKRFQSLDDAAETLAENLSALSDWKNEIVLIPDEPSVRRSLMRALHELHLWLQDPRDPTLVQGAEWIKRALVPVRMVASGYDRRVVIPWLLERGQKEAAQQVQALGWVRGLAGYGPEVEAIDRTLRGRHTLKELSDRVLSLIDFKSLPTGSRDFFEGFFGSWLEDREAIGAKEVRAAVAYWWPRLLDRLKEASPPIDALKPREGVRLYRLNQLPVDLGTRRPRLWILGLPPDYLTSGKAGDFWLSERDRERLGVEFSVRTGTTVMEERLRILSLWIQRASEVNMLDAEYDWEGRERSSLSPILRELDLVAEPERVGAHLRWLKSYAPLQLQEIPTVNLPQAVPQDSISASTLDRYSRCGFQALAGSVWRLKSQRQAGTELWPEANGNLLHRAVTLWLGSRRLGNSMSIAEALNRAWEDKGAQGLLRSPRLIAQAKRRQLRVLEAFVQAEKEYQERAGVKLWKLDDEEKLDLEFPEGRVVGVPDRVDEHPDGWVISDFKSSTQNACGQEMIEQGYRLQLPFYAVAARKRWKREVISAHFIELNRQARRTQGVFFKPWAGKDEGKITSSRSKKNVLEASPEEIWTRAEEQIHRRVKDWRAGRFDPRPQTPTECRSCAFDLVCGRPRRSQNEEEEA